jgi:transcription elongation GreA/GreB family factor
MGKKPGDTIKVTTPNGSREFEIRAVLTLYDQA